MHPHPAYSVPALYHPSTGWQYRPAPVQPQGHPHHQQQQQSQHRQQQQQEQMPREYHVPAVHQRFVPPPGFDAFVVNQVASSSNGYITPRFVIPGQSLAYNAPPPDHRVPLSDTRTNNTSYLPPPRSLAGLLDEAAKRTEKPQNERAHVEDVDKAYANASAVLKTRIGMMDHVQGSGSRARAVHGGPLMDHGRKMDHPNKSLPPSLSPTSASPGTTNPITNVPFIPATIPATAPATSNIPGPMFNPYSSHRFCHGCQRHLQPSCFISDTFDEYDEPWCVRCMRGEEKVGWVGVDGGGALYKLVGSQKQSQGEPENQNKSEKKQKNKKDKKEKEGKIEQVQVQQKPIVEVEDGNDDMMEMYTREFEEAAEAHDVMIQEAISLERQCGVLTGIETSIPSPSSPIPQTASSSDLNPPSRQDPTSSTKITQTRCTGSLHCRKHNISQKKAVVGRKEGYEVCVARLKLEIALQKEAKEKRNKSRNAIGLGRMSTSASSCLSSSPLGCSSESTIVLPKPCRWSLSVLSEEAAESTEQAKTSETMDKDDTLPESDERDQTPGNVSIDVHSTSADEDDNRRSETRDIEGSETGERSETP